MNRKILFALFFLFTAQFIVAQIIEPIKWTFELKSISSDTKEIVAKASIDNHWHLYAMGIPEGGPIATSFKVDKIDGANLVGNFIAKKQPYSFYDDMFQMQLAYYETEAVFVQKIKVTNPSNFYVSGFVRFMACNESSCLPPTEKNFSFGQKSGDSKPILSPTIGENDLGKPSLNKTSSDKVLSGNSPLEVDTQEESLQKKSSKDTILFEKSLTQTSSYWKPVIENLKQLGDVTSTKNQSFLLVFIFGFLGGLVALVTPCVWPMIPMTVSFFMKNSGDKKKSIKDASIYGLSIVIIYLALGILVTAIFGASSLNSLATNAVFNLLFFALLVVFAFSFFGFFEITLPSSWVNVMDKKADSTTHLLSIFFMAFTLVLVSFSCTGPIIGTLLVEAATSGSTIGPAIGMLGFALALAIPFALFAVFPSWLKALPRSGSWLNMVKVSLGFLELAFALKFFSVADLAYGWNILSRDMFIFLWILIFIVLGLYFFRIIRFPLDKNDKKITVSRIAFGILSFLFVAYLIPGMWGTPRKSISAFTPPMYTQKMNMYHNRVEVSFGDFDKAMNFAQKVQKPVLIDFTGYGCVNCREMEAVVFEDEKIKELMHDKFIFVSLYVDDKKSLPEPMHVEENGVIRTLTTYGDKWSYLQRFKFGANAQPYYVILDAKANPLVASYAFNKDIDSFENYLKEALKRFYNE